MKTLLDINDDGLISLAGVKYKLIGIAGQGGSSIVYKARREGAAEDYYMIKEFFPHGLAIGRKDDGSIYYADGVSDIIEKLMFRAVNESKTVDILRHGNENNNPWFLNYGNPISLNNTLYTVIQTEEGSMLSEKIHNATFADKSFIDLCEIVLKILDALEPIHSKKYLHLDISPDNIHHSNLNIMRMIDYNSAFPLSGNPDSFLPSFKQGYSAPELKRNTGFANLSYSTDLFSVAAIFFELLIGRPPEENDWINRSRWMLTSEEGILKGASGLLVKATNAFLRKSLSNKPEIRPQSVAQMREEINLLIELSASFVLVNSPKRPNPKFVCRESEIEAIGKRLESESYVILEGMGGIGKTELVKKYAWENRDNYEAIQFVTYNNSLMPTIALSLKFHNFDKAKESEYETRYGDEAVRFMYRDKVNSLKKASGTLPCLIIVDNYNVLADDDFADFVSGDYKVIFTSRNKHDGNILEITEMRDENHLLELFRNYYAPFKLIVSDAEVVKDIIKLVLGHTMTVMLIAVAMQKSRIAPTEMYERLNSGLDPKLRTKIGVEKENISAEVREQAMYQHITNLFDMTQIHDNPNYSFIMTNMALVPYTGMNITTFYDWVLKEHYTVDGYDDRDFSDIDKLIDLRWIQADEDGQHIFLHPVISDVANNELKPDSVRCERFIKLTLASSDNYDEETFIEQNRYADMLSMAAKRISDESKMTFVLILRYALLNYSLARYTVALEYFKKCIAICVVVYGENHPNVARQYHNIGLICYNMGDYPMMLEWSLKALAIQQETPGEEHDTADSYNNIAVAYNQQGDHPKAIEWHMKSLAIKERIFGNDMPEIAATYRNIALCYHLMENFEGALEWHTKSLIIFENKLGADRLETALSYSGVAAVYRVQGDYDNALKLLFKALAIYEKKLSKEHPDTARIYSQIANVYYVQGLLNETLNWAFKALHVFENKLSLIHPHTTTIYELIAVIFDKQGKTDKAEEYRRKATQGSEKRDN